MLNRLTVLVVFLATMSWVAAGTCARDRSVAGVIGWTVADFNGDGNPDVATLDGSEAESCAGVQVRFGASPASSRYSGEKQQFGVSVIARDIDNDNDFDIVVTNALLNKTLEVWINDGNGRFHKGDVASIASSKSDGASLRSDSELTGYEWLCEDQLLSPAILVHPNSTPVLAPATEVAVYVTAPPRSPSDRPKNSRAPPLLS